MGMTVVALVCIGLIAAYPIYSFVQAARGLIRVFAVKLGLAEPTHDDLVARGWQAERSGKWTDALAAYEEILCNHPLDSETEARRAQLVQRRPELAEEAERVQRERLAGLAPLEVLYHVAMNHSLRKLRLFVVACCRRTCRPHADEHRRAAIDCSEIHADQLLQSLEPLELAIETARANDDLEVSEPHTYSPRATTALWLSMHAPEEGADEALGLMSQVTTRDEQMHLLECIFGLPGRTSLLTPAWLTDTVIALAREMYESRDFSAIPILADALQDAGCDRADVLNHCRGPGPHVRGCWVVDLVLGKE